MLPGFTDLLSEDQIDTIPRIENTIISILKPGCWSITMHPTMATVVNNPQTTKALGI